MPGRARKSKSEERKLLDCDKEKDLYTYANNICLESMFCTYKEIKIAVSDSAMRELIKNSKTLFDVQEILEKGISSPRKRKKNMLEKWLIKGNKTYNAVIAKDYNEIQSEECWVLIHFGKFTNNRIKRDKK